jgi:SAM-dependent methyltransferase
MSGHDDDVPSPIDLRNPVDARAWADAAESARPGRSQIRLRIAEEVARLPAGAAVLELGSGPGFLAEEVLARCENVARYTLFDFSPPMLAMSRARLTRFAQAEFVECDFKSASWPLALSGPYDAVLAMQSVHEVRHKRHVPALYAQARGLLRPGGLLLVADHTPLDASPRWTALHSTADEQLEALARAGFARAEVLLVIDRLLLVQAR